MGNFLSESIIKKNNELRSITQKSILQVYQHVINEFLQLEEEKYNKLNLSSIVSVMVMFIGNIFIKFDVCGEQYDSCLRKYGLQFNRDNNKYMEVAAILKSFPAKYIHHPIQFVVTSHYGFGAKCIVSWNIKVIKYDWNKTHSMNYNVKDGLGVITQKCLRCYIKDNTFHVDTKQNIYCIGYDDHNVKFQTNDIIYITLNCKQWTLSFGINDKILVKQFDIEPNKVYFPCIISAMDGSKYQID
eukprot:404317_1